MGQNGYSKNGFWGNVRYGGGFALGFGDRSFTSTVAPSSIYQVSEQFATGIGLGFNYAKFDDGKLVAYGGSILTLYGPVPFLQFSAELEQLRVNRSLELVGEGLEDNYWSPSLFLGIGYRSYNVTFGLRYDVLYDSDKSIYADALIPFVRVYF